MTTSVGPSAAAFSEALRKGKLARVTLAACLAQIEGAAFIVSRRGSILHANAEGKKQAKAATDRLRARLTKAVESLTSSEAASDALVTELRGMKGHTYYLVIFRPPTSFEQRVEYAANLWGLTPRQAATLRLVAEGFTNKTIATELDCTERTVESHITAILAKSGLASRAALIASIARAP
jgi:DNA-binding NarL/FixJ family response regulator